MSGKGDGRDGENSDWWQRLRRRNNIRAVVLGWHSGCVRLVSVIKS